MMMSLTAKEELARMSALQERIKLTPVLDVQKAFPVEISEVTGFKPPVLGDSCICRH